MNRIAQILPILVFTSLFSTPFVVICSSEISPCGSVNCFNGGGCLFVNESYEECQCLDGFTGDDCKKTASSSATSNELYYLPQEPRLDISKTPPDSETSTTTWNLLPQGPENSLDISKTPPDSETSTTTWHLLPQGPGNSLDISKTPPDAETSTATWHLLPQGPGNSLDISKTPPDPETSTTAWHLLPEGKGETDHVNKSSMAKAPALNDWYLLPQGPREETKLNEIDINDGSRTVLPPGTSTRLKMHDIEEATTLRPSESVTEIMQSPTSSEVWNLYPEGSVRTRENPVNYSTPWNLVPEGPRETLTDEVTTIGISSTAEPTSSSVWNLLPELTEGSDRPTSTTNPSHSPISEMSAELGTSEPLSITTLEPDGRDDETNQIPNVSVPEDLAEGINSRKEMKSIVRIYENPCKKFDKKVHKPPCLNGGTCYHTDNLSFECECPKNFTGEFCEYVNACVSSPCHNGGFCQSFEDSGVCNCILGYSGPLCELRDDNSNNTIALDDDDLDKVEMSSTVGSLVTSSTKSASMELQNGTEISEGDESSTLKPEGSTASNFLEGEAENIPTLASSSTSTSPSSETDLIGTSSGNVSLLVKSPERVEVNRNTHVDPCKKFEETLNEKACLNGGTCYHTDDLSFECECPSRFTGESCEYVNACLHSPCRNGGTCQNFQDSGVCNCLVGYSGKVCEVQESLVIEGIKDEDFDGIENSTTSKSQRILNPVTMRSKIMKEAADVSDPCYVRSYVSEMPCLNGGTCISLKGKNSYECECPDNFTGTFCQFANACAVSPCKNGGRCESFEDSGVCTCPNGYTGTYCEQVDTVSHRRPKNTVDTVKWKLENKRESSTTSVLYIEATTADPCIKASEDGNQNQTCKNNAKCNPIDEVAYECECSKEFTGELCQFKNLCFDLPCQNGGTCEAFEDSAVCTCPAWSIGTFCETDLSPSTEISVDHFKTTRKSRKRKNKLKSRFARRRRLKKGRYDLDACEENESDGGTDNRCLNGGTCLPLKDKKSYDCECADGFVGKYCQFVDACVKSPCINGGICESHEDSGTCSCPHGFSGTYCEEVGDSNEASKTRHRFSNKREKVISSIFDNCINAEMDESKPHCMNGAKCTLLDDDEEHGYACECRDGFTGSLCEYLNACASAPCINGGTCESYEETAVCNCPVGFNGTYCQDAESDDGTNSVLTEAEEAGKKESSVFEHIYRSKIRDRPPYPMYVQMKSAHFEAVTPGPAPHPVIPIPGFEDITKDMIRIAKDGTIYIRKPKKILKGKSSKTSLPTEEEDEESGDGNEEHEESSTERHLRSLDATIVKVMPNGELFIKVLVPKS